MYEPTFKLTRREIEQIKDEAYGRTDVLEALLASLDKERTTDEKDNT